MRASSSSNGQHMQSLARSLSSIIFLMRYVDGVFKEKSVRCRHLQRIIGSCRVSSITTSPQHRTSHQLISLAHSSLTRSTFLPVHKVVSNVKMVVKRTQELPQKQSPENSSMLDGRFREYNTEAPQETSIKQLLSLEHKTAIVSGSGAGIGLQVVHAFAEAGANVAIWYHGNKEALDRAAEIEKKYGVKCTKSWFSSKRPY